MSLTRTSPKDPLNPLDHHRTSRLLHLTLSKAKSLLHSSNDLSAFPTESFPLFPFLPFEIRALIWFFALPAPRVLELSTRFPPYTSHLPRMWYSSAPLPTLLSVSQEARREAQRHYTRAFARNGYDAMTYVDFWNDTVFLHRWGSLLRAGSRYTASQRTTQLIVDEDWKSIKNLALSRGAFAELEDVMIKEVLGGVETLWCIEGWRVGRREAKLRDGLRIRELDLRAGVDHGLLSEIIGINRLLNNVGWERGKRPMVKVGRFERRFDDGLWVDCEY